MDTPKQPSHPWLTPAIGLALISALTYCYAYTFQAGFCEHFGIPVELIHLDVVNLVIVGGFMLSLIISTYFGFALVSMYVYDKSRPWYKRLLSLLPIFALLALGITTLSPEGFFAYAGMAVIAIVLYYELAGKFAILRNPASTASDLFLSTLEARSILWMFRAIIYAWILAGIVHMAGIGYATGKTTYLVPSSIPNTLVLKIYGETLICAKADLTKHEIYPVLSFYPLNSEVGKSLKSQNFKKITVVQDLRYY